MTYVETDYEGDGTLVAAEVGSGRDTVRALVYSGSDPGGVRAFAPWSHYREGGVGLGEDGANDLFIWTQPAKHLRRPGELRPDDYALAYDVEIAVCERRLDPETCALP